MRFLPKPSSFATRARARPLASFAAASLFLLGLGACRASGGPDPLERGRALQSEIRRAIIESKSLGRFGLFALIQEGLEDKPCRTPISDANRHCEVNVIGRGEVRLTVADARFAESDQVRRDAVVAIEYPADCENQGFDFKSIDNALPRAGATRDGITEWEGPRLRVTHARLPSENGDRCRVWVRVSPAFLDRIAGTPGTEKPSM